MFGRRASDRAGPSSAAKTLKRSADLSIVAGAVVVLAVLLALMVVARGVERADDAVSRALTELDAAERRVAPVREQLGTLATTLRSIDRARAARRRQTTLMSERCRSRAGSTRSRRCGRSPAGHASRRGVARVSGDRRPGAR